MESYAAFLVKNYPNFLNVAEKFVPALIALVAAFFAAVIAYRQWRTAHNRLRLDLYEKRFAIFEAVMTLVARIQLGSAPSNELIRDFMRSTKGVEYLFKKDISAYLQGIKSNVNLLTEIEYEISESSNSDERKNKLEAARMIREQLEREFNGGTVSKFRKYLSFESIK